MNKFKTFLISFFISFFLLVFAHFAPLVFVDPLNVVRVQLSENEFYIKEMRFQAAPIINKIDFDSAIIGTSMAENFSPREAGEKFGGRFLNLSMSGSLYKERSVVLEYLLAKKDIKTIIFSLDGAYNIQRNKGIPMESWSFLYNDHWLDDLYVYANRKYSPYISCYSLFNSYFFAVLYGECREKKVRKSVERLTEWQSDPYHYLRFGGVDNWIEYRENPQLRRSIEELESARLLLKSGSSSIETKTKVPNLYDMASFGRDVAPLIERYPDTQFILFFPPYSIYKYAIDAQTTPFAFSQYKKFVERVVLEAEVYPNAKVFWFADRSFINDIANYKDLTHYSAEFNSLFLAEFSDGRSVINNTNYIRLLSDLERRAQRADIVTLAEKLSGD